MTFSGGIKANLQLPSSHRQQGSGTVAMAFKREMMTVCRRYSLPCRACPPKDLLSLTSVSYWEATVLLVTRMKRVSFRPYQEFTHVTDPG